MKKLGDKKHIGSKIQSHQDCSICQPKIKNGKAKYKEESKKEIEIQMKDLCTEEHCYHTILKIEHDKHIPPTYKELADLLIELTEKYVANIDADESDWWFINCITPQGIPSYWDRAMKYRKLLRKNNI